MKICEFIWTLLSMQRGYGKISEYQMPIDQKSLTDQKMYAEQLGQLFFLKYHNFTIK